MFSDASRPIACTPGLTSRFPTMTNSHNRPFPWKCACGKFVSPGTAVRRLLEIRGKLSLNYEPLKRLCVSRFHPLFPNPRRFASRFFSLSFFLFFSFSFFFAFSCSNSSRSDGHAFRFAGGEETEKRISSRKRMAPAVMDTFAARYPRARVATRYFVFYFNSGQVYRRVG